MAGEDGLGGERGVEPEAHLAQHEVAHRVHPVGVHQFLRPDHVAERFRHLGGVHVPVAVHVQALEGLQPHGAEHGRPVDGVRLEDILGDHVLGRRPGAGKVGRVRVADAGEVVDERVEPDIGDELVVKRQGDAPGEARGGPGNAQVLQWFAQEREHLVAVALRGDELRVAFDVVDEPVLVAAHAEEIVLLADRQRLHQVVRALAVDQLLLGEEPLAAPAVEAGVLAEVDVAAVVHQLEDALHRGHVVRVGGADDVVRFHGQVRPGLAEGGGEPVGVLARGLAGLGRGLGDLLAVLVGAGLEAHLVTAEPAEAAVGVGDDGRVGMPQVRHGVDVVDRGGDVGRHVPSLLLRLRGGRSGLCREPAKRRLSPPRWDRSPRKNRRRGVAPDRRPCGPDPCDRAAGPPARRRAIPPR